MAKSNLVRKQFHERLVLDVMEVQDSRGTFAEDVARGLSASPKSLPPKYFYDEQGSLLFEQITELEEYYLTRTEAGMLAAHGHDMLAAAGDPLTLVELGSGSSSKTRLLLDILAEQHARVDYVPIDISPTVVTEFGEQLLNDYPSLHIRGLICDYHQALGELKAESHGRRLFSLPGLQHGQLHTAAGRAIAARGQGGHGAAGPAAAGPGSEEGGGLVAPGLRRRQGRDGRFQSEPAGAHQP